LRSINAKMISEGQYHDDDNDGGLDKTWVDNDDNAGRTEWRLPRAVSGAKTEWARLLYKIAAQTSLKLHKIPQAESQDSNQ